MAKPVLKWAGGKRSILEEIKACMPDEYGRYHEPMIGGGALFFDLEPEEAEIGDINPRIVNFYRYVRDNPEEIIEIARTFEDPESDPDPDRPFHDEDRKGKTIGQYYYQQRALFNRRPNDEDFDPVEEAALLLYLNRTGFNGLYRENQSGRYNVAIGRYSNPDWVQADRVREASEVLANTLILQHDFEIVSMRAAYEDFVYIDPPYEPMSPTADFTTYSKQGFDKQDQNRLLGVATMLKDRRVSVVVTNSAVMTDRYEREGFNVVSAHSKREINRDAEGRGEVEEMIAYYHE